MPAKRATDDRGPRPDRGCHPSCRGPVAAIRAEQLGIARGAQPSDVDARDGNACPLELITGRLPAIEIPVPGPPGAGKPARELCRREAGLFKPRAHSAVHFVPWRADRRPDGRDQIRRAAAELANHRLDGDAWNGLRKPPPARVRRCDRSGPGIREEQRHAIRRLNRERNRGIIAQNDIGLQTGRDRLPATLDHDTGAVDLADPEPSGHGRVVKTWRATSSSGRHTRTGPDGASLHSKLLIADC
jgi:hypothetical protein